MQEYAGNLSNSTATVFYEGMNYFMQVVDSFNFNDIKMDL